jgi:hypothetical protein
VIAARAADGKTPRMHTDGNGFAVAGRIRCLRCIAWLALGWLADASVAVTEPSPLQVSSSGREIVDSHGRPVFLLADTAWSLALRGSREDAEFYLTRRKAQRFNCVTFVLFAPGRTELTGTMKNHYGDVPFEVSANRPDPTRPVTTTGADPQDPQQYDYWDHVDHLVRRTRELGLYAIVLPTWGSGISGSYDGKNTSEIVFSAESARAYGAWLARRYGAEPHVIWMLGGDRAAVADGKDYRSVVRAMAEGLRAAKSRQLMSYHSRKGAPQSGEWFHADDWLAFNSNQEWPDQQVRCITEDRARTPAKPTWLFEGRYEGYWRGNTKAEDWGEWQVRQQAYQTVCAGAFGHTYGHERVFGFGHDGAAWKEFLEAPGARSMTHLANLIGRLSTVERMSSAPDPALIDGDAGKPQRLRSDSVLALRMEETGKVLVYSANGRAVRLRLGRLVAGTYWGYWYNPRSGLWHRADNESPVPTPFATDIRAGSGVAGREFTPPSSGDGQDWVLMLAPRAVR